MQLTEQFPSCVRRLAGPWFATPGSRSRIVASALASALALAVAFPLTVAAAEGGHSGGRGQGGSHGGSHDSGSHEDGSHEDGEHEGGSGRGGRGKGVEDKVFRGGTHSGREGRGGGVEDRVLKGRGGDAGTRPAWAGGAVPEDLELGRLNMARSPDHVLNRALEEAYATNLDKNKDGSLDADASLANVESPMQNLALFKEAFAGSRKVSGTWTLQDAAQFLGKAADKNIPISEDTVRAVGVILGSQADLSAFTYDRAAVHAPDLGIVFNNVGYSGTGAAAFAQAADDARKVVQYHHDNP